MQLNRFGPSAVLLLVATVALLAATLVRPPSLASAGQAETALDDSISASGAVIADHAGWSGGKKLAALERVTGGNDDAPKPANQGDEPAEPGDTEEPPEPGESSGQDEPAEPADSSEPDEPEEPSEPDEPAEPSEPSEPVEPEEPSEPEEPAEPAESEEPSGPVEEPDTGAGLRTQQVTVSVFLAVVIVIGAMLAVSYRRR